MTTTVCYCYNYSEEDIRADVLRNNGQSTLLAFIAAEKKKQACQCHSKHPQRR